MSVLKTRWAFHLVIYLIVSATWSCSVDRAYAQAPADIRKVLDGRMLPGEEVTTFERRDLLYPADVVKRGSTIQPLATARHKLQNVTFQIENKRYDLYDYLALNRVAGLLVLKTAR